jgi:hypothetical protein
MERNMAEDEALREAGVKSSASAVSANANVRIAPETQVIFADGIASHAWTPNLSKFYLVRYDSDPLAQAASNTQTFVAQIVMPNDGFVMSFAFLEHRLKMMLEGGAITKESVDKAREFWLNVTA